jgi:hypothetical protein
MVKKGVENTLLQKRLYHNFDAGHAHFFCLDYFGVFTAT